MSVREVELPGCDRALTVHQADTGSEVLADDAGAVVWDSALVLIHYLAKLRQQQAQREPARPRGVPLAGARVLELGAGTGAVGLAAALLGAARVLLTDRPHLMGLLNQNIEANALGGSVAAVPYEWGGPLPDAAGFEGGFDLVLLSDLVYEPATLGPLVGTLAMLLGGSGGGGGGTAAAEANGGAPHAAAGPGSGGAGAGGGPSVLVAVELRTDTGVAQFVRALVQRGYYVERVPGEELNDDWRDDDIWVFVVRRQR
ncbi:hypothetical protein Rsub_13034 [Raphidocelis subcapitata]|uniref:Uncharacterized protein n=1 Tax=Raphidocelis subcapitata TaxID=307507 RepID=A0A2V0PSK1_9CHLO|nr:hypothetical protein Rsub_13034 [Raphidocelis subcapitata]|eukprot:GBG00326.1 hypothetical protein Rsub_13034 [Raphidocelis subcapitata]